jgi:hypothetical protein
MDRRKLSRSTCAKSYRAGGEVQGQRASPAFFTEQLVPKRGGQVMLRDVELM